MLFTLKITGQKPFKYVNKIQLLYEDILLYFRLFLQNWPQVRAWSASFVSIARSKVSYCYYIKTCCRSILSRIYKYACNVSFWSHLIRNINCKDIYWRLFSSSEASIVFKNFKKIVKSCIKGGASDQYGVNEWQYVWVYIIVIRRTQRIKFSCMKCDLI